MEPLIEKIRRREARCGVIGLGYVGLPLALEFARAGFEVVGIDLDHPGRRRKRHANVEVLGNSGRNCHGLVQRPNDHDTANVHSWRQPDRGTGTSCARNDSVHEGGPRWSRKHRG